ncbi:MAG TPA: lamin tail domain-containing protein [Chloroflexota bacterium]|nr:lamin tail domain-containing protein [Chloroflexota bacterium]
MGRLVLAVTLILLCGSLAATLALLRHDGAYWVVHADSDMPDVPDHAMPDVDDEPSVAVSAGMKRFAELSDGATTSVWVDLPTGRFFVQGHESAGYAVTDDLSGPPFWTAYQRVDGADALGLPRSRPFLLPDAQIYQVFQYGALRWRPGASDAGIADLMDLLSAAGLDDWLAMRGVPPTRAVSRGRRWLDLDDLEREPASTLLERLDWLTEDVIRATYWSASFPGAVGQLRSAYLRYGLPTSRPELMGDLVVQRFQRGVLAVRLPGVNDDQGDRSTMTLAVGDLLRQSGLLDGRALAPDHVVGGQLVARAPLPRVSWRSDQVWGIATPAIPAAQPALTSTPTPAAATAAATAAAAAPTAVLSPGAKPVIREVINQGRSESVLILNEGTSAQNLTSWVLRSLTGGQTYAFPAGTVLAPGATVRVHSGQGASNKHQPPGDLFATNSNVWRNEGDTAVLLDPSGTVISRLTYANR